MSTNTDRPKEVETGLQQNGVSFFVCFLFLVFF